MGKYQARISADHLLGHDARALARRRRQALPARDLHRAAGRGRRAHDRERREGRAWSSRRSTTSTSGNAGGSFYGRNAPGTTQWIVDTERRIVVGCTITGAEVADFLHAATIAIVGEVPLERLKHAIPSFPTRSEIWLQLGALKEVDAEGAARGPSAPPRLAPALRFGRRAFHLKPRSLRLNLRV